MSTRPPDAGDNSGSRLSGPAGDSTSRTTSADDDDEDDEVDEVADEDSAPAPAFFSPPPSRVAHPCAHNAPAMTRATHTVLKTCANFQPSLRGRSLSRPPSNFSSAPRSPCSQTATTYFFLFRASAMARSASGRMTS